jgi:EAL domain-containing protein (putative c-di-GMP-specific phosphodiesterase class I)
MFKWPRTRPRQRASDRPRPAQAQRRDRLLETAITHEQIAILFQPQIEPVSGAVAGVEALARWEGVASADHLFARAGAAGLSERLSRLVQRKALRTAGCWEGPLGRLRVSLNMLPQDLLRAGYDRWLLEQIEAAGIDPKRVTVEITESALLPDLDEVVTRLEPLRSAGLSIALDDFGTGYASLSYLAGLPLDALKIDRSLIERIGDSERDRLVVRAIIALARELGLKVIVEGVENSGQLALLVEWGCDLYQGFLGAGALDAGELARFIHVFEAQAA